MTTATVKLTTICPGGGHLVFTITGVRNLTLNTDLPTLSDGITDEDALAFIRVISRMAKAGRTVAQAKTLLQTGVVVTV